jgi:hypothetical protein
VGWRRDWDGLGLCGDGRRIRWGSGLEAMGWMELARGCNGVDGRGL